MKQKLLFALMLLCMSLCSPSVWAEHERPTMPTASLVSGNTYYLYNVEADLFLEYDETSTSTLGIKENALPIEITLLDNGAYTMRVTSISNGYVWGFNDCRINYGSDGNNSKFCYWSIMEEDGSFLIQRSTLNTGYYDADQYLGWQGNNATSVLPNRPITDGVHWKLIPADGTGDRYVAALKLYKALQMADAFVENGWNIDYYNDLYSMCATADIKEMTNAAYGLRNGLNMSQGYKAPYWNEYPILWQCSEGVFGKRDYTWSLPDNNYTTGTYFQRSLGNSGESTLSATVQVDEPSAFIYGLYCYKNGGGTISITVYVDGIKTRELINEQLSTYPMISGNYYNQNYYTRYFETLETGTHTITWVSKSFDTNSSNNYRVVNAGVMKSPFISVNLLEPGSLGTEVLYNTNHIKNVRRLKIKGKMNSDDWAKIKMMHYLQDLDLSEADITEIPESQFSCAADTSSMFIHAMKLPEGLEKINRGAFYYSFIDHLEFPSSVKMVDESAFTFSHLQELLLPDNLTDIRSSSNHRAFDRMYWLKRLVCPKNLTVIPAGTFLYNLYCKDVTLPEQLIEIGNEAFYRNQDIKTTFPNKLTRIGNQAFYECYKAEFSPLPESLQSIGDNAFYNCNGIKTLKIPENVSSIGNCAFRYCYYLKDVEIGTCVYNLRAGVFDGCTRLETLRLNSPTVVTYDPNSQNYPVTANHIKDVTLIVPNHIVTSYKLDNYWYNFNSIEGFSTAEIQNWDINYPLVLNRDRFEGIPNIAIEGGLSRKPSLKINGESPMIINNLRFGGNNNNYANYPGQILSNCSNTAVNGDVSTDLYTKGKYWYFFSLPFDIKVNEITHSITGEHANLSDNVQMAIRYYDGANRAANGASGSWKNFDADAVIPAGTGFIMQTNVDTWNYFHALDNETKQQCVSNKEFVTLLAVNDSENASNKGWNLVGNPWQCWYNDHALNFTGPITVWNVANRTYTAYSITDDDYAIRPNEAFFVQCSNEQFNTIGFPTNGRQLTDVIETQNASNARVAANVDRQLVDVIISNGENEDQTRVVLNEQASMDYELACDAAKMMSMDASVPQIFTTDAFGTLYAINERPAESGIIPLGFLAPADGTYTLSLGRNNAEEVILIDYETGTEQSIVDAEYRFSAHAGMNDGRFALKFSAGITTGIRSAEDNDKTAATIYNLAGQRIFNGTQGVNIVNGKKVVNQ